MLFEIDLTRFPGDKQRGCLISEFNRLATLCRADPEPIVTDRAVWKKHLLADGYSKVNLRQFAKIKDQTGPSCTSNATVGAYEALLRFAGVDCPTLSAASLFAFVGGPGGSSVQDNVDRIVKVGCVPESLWPASSIYGRKPAGFDGEAPRWRLRNWEYVADFAAGSWLLLRGRPIVFGVSWGGGHCIWACRLYWSAAKGWGWEIANSWGTDWGDDGFGILYESQIQAGIARRYGAAAPLMPTF
jgi:hypothetical protein